jgi:putative ABC transport system substrate-binding protein
MRRRELLCGLGSTAVAWPFVTHAQQAKRRPLIGWLGGGSPVTGARQLDAFLRGLGQYGYEDGKTIDIAYRWAAGDPLREPTLANELVALNPAVIVTASDTGPVAVTQATSSIPVVGALIIAPVELGLAASYDRPGRNLTGVLNTIDSLPGKQVELLLQLIPAATIVGVLVNPANRTHPIMLRNLETEARGKQIKFVPVEVRTPFELESAFETLKRDRVEGLLVLLDGIFFTQAARIITLAAVVRLPAIHGFRQHVEQGGLMSYGVDVPQNFRRATYFVDRILKGTRAGDLPIELPTKFEMVINLKTAKALGLEVPSKLLFTADEVIE